MSLSYPIATSSIVSTIPFLNIHQQSDPRSSINKATLADKLEKLQLEYKSYGQIFNSIHEIFGPQHSENVDTAIVNILNKLKSKRQEIIQVLNDAGYKIEYIRDTKLHDKINNTVLALRNADPTKPKIDDKILLQFREIE